MKSFPRWTAICCVSMCYALAGCEGGKGDFKTAEELKKERPVVAKGEHDHDHDHGHEHGHDEHHHHAPHHGSLTMLGEHVAQIELVLDAETGKLEVFVLDGEAEKPLTVDQPELELIAKLNESSDSVTLKLKPIEGGTPDQGFLLEDALLKGVKTLKGTLTSLKIGEKTHEKVAVEYDAKKAADDAHEAHEHGDKKDDAHKDHDHKDKDHDHEAEHKDEKPADAAVKPADAPAEKPADAPAEKTAE